MRLGNRTYGARGRDNYFSKIDTYRGVRMQIAYGRVRRKTEPTGPGESKLDEKIEN